VRDANAYPWHDHAFRAPAVQDLIVYQFHIGVFHARDEQGADRRPGRVAKILDAVQRVPYLAELGVTAFQPLPFAEFQTTSSLGYNGTDLFPPETDYSVPAQELGPYLDTVNALLAAKGCVPLTQTELDSQVNQLKAFVDICHLYGIAVLADVVYKHVGGELDRQSLDPSTGDWTATSTSPVRAMRAAGSSPTTKTASGSTSSVTPGCCWASTTSTGCASIR
jgi:1,4-alpha-glucan branching enzyme